jgi:hypothetical protein
MGVELLLFGRAWRGFKAFHLIAEDQSVRWRHVTFARGVAEWVPVEVPRLSGSTSSEDRKNDGIASHVSLPAPHRASLPAA